TKLNGFQECLLIQNLPEKQNTLFDLVCALQTKRVFMSLKPTHGTKPAGTYSKSYRERFRITPCRICKSGSIRGLCRQCYLRTADRGGIKMWKWREHLKSRYGLTEEKWNALAEQQAFLCKICLRKKRLMVDHCHLTGKVQGLLC